MYGLALKCGQLTRGYTLKENHMSFQQLSITNSSFLGIGLVPTFPLCTVFGLSCVFQTAVSGKLYFFVVVYQFSLSLSLSLSLLSLGERRYNIDVSFRAENSAVFYFLYFVLLWVSVSTTIYEAS
jgi:hypothetical protein